MQKRLASEQDRANQERKIAGKAMIYENNSSNLKSQKILPQIKIYESVLGGKRIKKKDSPLFSSSEGQNSK